MALSVTERPITMTRRPGVVAALVALIALAVAVGVVIRPSAAWIAGVAAVTVGWLWHRVRALRAPAWRGLRPVEISDGIAGAVTFSAGLSLLGHLAPITLVAGVLSFAALVYLDRGQRRLAALAVLTVCVPALIWRFLPTIDALIATAGIAAAWAAAVKLTASRDESEPHAHDAAEPLSLDAAPRIGNRLSEQSRRTVTESIERTLRLSRAALRGQSAVVLIEDAGAGSVSIGYAETCVDELITTPFSARVEVMESLRASEGALFFSTAADRPLPWYVESGEQTHAIAVTLAHEGQLIGHLVVDRNHRAGTFSEIDGIALANAAESIIATIGTEQTLADAARIHEQMSILHNAADLLNRASTVEQVCAEANNAILRVVPDLDLVAFTEARANGEAQVIWADGVMSEGLDDHTFPLGRCVVSAAIKHREIAPWSGAPSSRMSPVFGEGHPLPGAGSLITIPLVMGGNVLGTVTLAARDAGVFSARVRERLSLISKYVAAAFSNAINFRTMEALATTDGMTGLLNRRAFNERALDAVDRTQRKGRTVSLIITDIDHFKRVNDTWGHSAGDEVIRSVARELSTCLRRIDLGARYGGEEFAILLEEADTETAARVAERLRASVEAMPCSANGEEFQVTLSLGVATMPLHAGSLEELVEAADAALYAAKGGGRNQVVIATAIDSQAA